MRFLFVELHALVVVEHDRTDSDPRRQPWFHAATHVANQPIAHHVLDVLESAGVETVVVASPAELAADVRACFDSRRGRFGGLIYVQRPGPLDLAGALELAMPVIDGAPCIVQLASGLLDQPLVPFMERLRKESPDAMLIAPRADSAEHTLDSSGIWMFGADALRQVVMGPGPKAGGLDASVVAEHVTACGGKFHVQLVDRWRTYRGDPVDLLELNRIALDRLDPPGPRSSGEGNRIEGTVVFDERASVSGCVILGPTVIGPGATVRDAYIGPYTSIGPCARIEGAEIERSIICAGASILHIGGRLVMSVVGRNARVFHDFSLPRALRLRVGDGTEIALC